MLTHTATELEATDVGGITGATSSPTEIAEAIRKATPGDIHTH